MSNKYEARLTTFLSKYSVLGEFKRLLEEYGSIKNFYVFCENTEPEMAIRSAFAWNCEDTIKGCDFEKFWTHLNSMWQDCLNEWSPMAEQNQPDEKTLLQATKIYFGIVGFPTSTKKFAKTTRIPQAIVDKAYAEAREEKEKKRKDLFKDEEDLISHIKQFDEGTKSKVEEEKYSAEELVQHDWLDMDLQELGVRTRKTALEESPRGNKIRVSIHKGAHIVVFSKEICDELRQHGCEESMEVCVDRITNRMVFVFGKKKNNKLTYYLGNGTLKVQSKVLVSLMANYLQLRFEEDKLYYIDVNKMQYSVVKSQCALVVTNKYSNEQ